MLAQLADDLWVIQHPSTFIGLNFNTRMTAVRLPDGSLLLYSPIPITDTLAAELDRLGPVRHIVAPNLFHHLFVGDAAGRWPEAKVYAPNGLAKKRPDLTIHHAPDALPDSIGAISLAGMAPLSETVLLHAPSRTVISCDLVLNITDPKGWWTKLYLSLSGINGRPGVSKVVAMSAFKDRTAMRASLDEILAFDFDRLILAHGDVVLTDGKRVLRESFEWMK